MFEGDTFNAGFEDGEVRRRFIIKVYTLLLLQLFISCAIIFVCVFVPVIHDFLRDDIIILLCCGILGLIFFITLSCCRCVRVQVPANYIVLTLMTLTIGLAMGSFSAKMKTYVVLGSLGITAAVVIFLSLLATSPCFDITGWIIYLLVISLVVSLVSMVILILALVLNMPILFMVYAGIGALLYSVFIVFDTQMILGGRKYEISPEEYILGSVTLFVDIVGLFMMLMTLMSSAGR